MANPTEPKVNSDTFSPPSNYEEISIPSYEAQVQDPFSLMREAARKRLYQNDPSEVKERLVEVLEVHKNVKKPADFNHFGNFDTMKSYGDTPFICVIARILDLDAGIPNPELTIDPQTGKYNFSTISKMRSHVGKFYAPVTDGKGTRIENIEVGDWLSAEFQDKTNMKNGIIKKIYAKKNSSSNTASSPIPGSNNGNRSGPLLTSRQPANTPTNPTPLQEIWTLLAICAVEGGTDQDKADVAQSIYNRYWLEEKYHNANPYTNGYPVSIAALVVAANQYQPVFTAPEVWASIVDENSAIEAIQAYRGPTYVRTNAQRLLKRAFDSLSNPANQNAARAWVGFRPDFLGGYGTADGFSKHSFARERGVEYFTGSPNLTNSSLASASNVFHLRSGKKDYLTAKQVQQEVANNINDAKPIPSKIRAFLAPGAQWPPS
jgi:hypothetical protein